MDELVDELSSAMIDVDESGNGQINGSCHMNTAHDNRKSNDVNGDDETCNLCTSTDTVMRPVSKNHHKPVARSASILIRSKLLILTDSDSDDNDRKTQVYNGKMNSLNGPMKLKPRKLSKNHKRINHSERQKLALQMQLQLHSSTFTGKRKRSSTISDGCSNASASGSTGSTHVTSQMECDDESDSSSLSDTPYNSEANCDGDGDDEQSDFYEVIARTNKDKSRHQRHHHNQRPMEFVAPSARNPFVTMGLSPSSTSAANSSSANVLWKRRRRMH